MMSFPLHLLVKLWLVSRVACPLGMSSYPTRRAEERFQEVCGLRRGGVTLVLENIRKENVALVARTAEALGVGSLYAIHSPTMNVHLKGFGDLTDAEKAAQLSRISRSATDWLTIEAFPDVASCLAALDRDGFDTFVATTPPDTDFNAIGLYDEEEEKKKRVRKDDDDDQEDDWALRRCAVLLGSEGHGLSADLLRAAHVNVTVPQRGMSQSLNVAACAAIVLGEMTRRRDRAGLDDSLAPSQRDALLRAILPNDGYGRPIRYHNKAANRRRQRAHDSDFKAEIEYERQHFDSLPPWLAD